MKLKREKDATAGLGKGVASGRNGISGAGGKGVGAVTPGGTVDLGLCPKCKKLKQGTNMFQCDKCKRWHHPECCGITEEEANVMAQMGSWEKWFCPDCEKQVLLSLSSLQQSTQNKRKRRGKRGK